LNAGKRKRRTHGRARAAARRARSAASVRALSPLGLRLRASRSLLLIVDVHERLAPAVHGAEHVIANCAILMRAATLLGVPMLVTEHCPQQLGPTVASLSALAPAGAILTKVNFSAADEPAVAQRIAHLNRPQIIIAGMESHVCVLQTALGLTERGYRAHVVADASGSRRASSHAVALDRLRAASVPAVTTEMVLFEWLEHAERPQLRELLALIK
jgi:nicotinamidase-related amidase